MTACSFSNKESYIWKKQGIYLIRKFPKSRGKEADMEKTEGMEEKNRSFGRGVLYGAVGALVVVALLYMAASPFIFTAWRKGGLSAGEANQIVKKLDSITRELDDLYLEELDRETMLEDAYSSYVASLGDRYTCYYTREEYALFQESTSGIYSGVGITVTMDQETGYLKVVEIQKGSPAEGTQIRPGDLLLKVDGTDLQGMKQEQMVSMIKGEEGTKVVLEFRHGVSGSVYTEELTRKKMETETVRSTLLEDGIGYLALEGFEEVTTHQFEEALQSLKEQQIRGLVIDLRNNPGGRLDVVTDILDTLLPEGIITYTEDKWGNREDFTSDADCLELPLAVVINGNSASASEIFAGAVKDFGTGTLIGTKTYGKGIVQRTLGLGDGTALKVTMARYYTPKGSYIHGVGIEPDIAVDLPESTTYSKNLPYEEDIQLQTAVEAVKTKLGK